MSRLARPGALREQDGGHYAAYGALQAVMLFARVPCKPSLMRRYVVPLRASGSVRDSPHCTRLRHGLCNSYLPRSLDFR